MELCSNNHDEVCYEGRQCPACALSVDYQKQIDDLEAQVEDAQSEIEDLSDQINNKET